MHYSLKRLTTRVQCDVLLAYAQAKLSLPIYPNTPAGLGPDSRAALPADRDKPAPDLRLPADRPNSQLAGQGQLGGELFGPSEPGALRLNFPLPLVQDFITRVVAHRATLPG